MSTPEPRIPRARTSHDQERLMTQTTTSSLYDEVGGRTGLSRAATLACEQAAADPALGAALSGKDLTRLATRYARWLGVLAGGPQPRPGRDAARAAADPLGDLDLDQGQRARLAGHLLDALHDLGVDETTTARLAQVLDSAPTTRPLTTSTTEGSAVLTSDDLTDGSVFGASLASEEHARFQSMLDNAPTNVIFADRDLVVTYLNPASLRTLRTLEQHLPVKADDVLGSSLDVFHKTPSYQRGILASADNLPRRANIQLGPETLDLLVSAITDASGAFIGVMATWEVITDRLRAEREVA
ncbi:MAG: globin domain-containing protein, partial [Mycobacteriales bacterium]